MCIRYSALKLATLPDAFGITFLTIGIILALVPYFAGANFGIFHVPRVQPATGRTLRWGGPLVLMIAVFLHLPVWPLVCPQSCTSVSAVSDSPANLAILNSSSKTIRISWRSHE